MKGWIIPIAMVVVLVLSTWGFLAYREIRATVRTNRIEAGDRFEVRLVSRNPYENDIVFSGTVIERSGSYILYVSDERGDTLSTNIRDCYLFPKVTEVKLIKKQ